MATPSKNRWELEEKRKKQAQQQALAAVQSALKSGTAYKGNAVSNNVQKAAAASTAQKTTTTPKANTVTVSKPQGANIPTFLQGTGKTSTAKVSTPSAGSTLSQFNTLHSLPILARDVSTAGRLGTPENAGLMRELQANSLKWWQTEDQNEKNNLHARNDALRNQLGLTYQNGSTIDPQTGNNLSAVTSMLYGTSSGARTNTAARYASTQLPQIISQQAKSENTEKGIGERVLETIEASTKRVRAGLDNWFATGNLAADEEAEQKFLAGETLGWLDRLRMKDRWGDNWESYLSTVRDAYKTGDTEIIADYENRAKQLNGLYDTTPLFDEAAQQAEAAKTGLGAAGRTALDALGMGADMLGTASIASTGGGGAGLFTGVSSLSAAGQASDQARRMGASAAQQEDYGNAVGALNFAVERLGGIGGGQAAAKIVNRMLPEAVKNAAGKVTSTAVGRVLAGGAEEGLEGAIQSEGERALRNVILNANERFDPGKFGADIGYNALMGSLFRGGQEVAGTVLGGARQGQAGNITTQQTGQTDGTATASSSGFLLPEAKRQRMAAQDAAYAAQIDGVFSGAMPERYSVTIGDTPDILLSLGATDIPMTMTQSTARKIAMPDGYMGGSHNLGIAALKHLPEQMRDPAAVLRSKTQPDSFVVLTEWNDTSGNPVVVALHLDKQGFVNISNEVASAYGKKNFAVLTGDKGENVLYTKNNKSIDELLYGRLQLPATGSDDTLVAYSIAQQAGKSNAEQETQALGARLAELDAERRQAEGLLPGPIRNRAIAQAEQAMREVQQQAQTEPIAQTQADVQIPAAAAMQYGKTPELAMMEARERARNAAAQAARDQQIVQDLERSEGAIRSDNPYYGLTRQQLENELAFAKQRIERARKDKNSDKAGRLLNQYRQIEQAIEDAKAVSFKTGDRVFALDRNNFGEIVKDRGDGYFDVYFVDTQTGENGIHTLHGDLLQSIMPGEDVPRVTPQEAMNEAKVKEAGRIRQALREAHRNIVSGQAEIERFARAQDRTNPKAVNANDLAQINRAANSTVDTIAGTALVDRKGDKIGDSWVDVVGDLTPEQIEQLTLYRLHKHNIDRMSLFERTQDARTEAAMEYDAFLNENPAFKSMTEQSVEDWRRNGTPGEQALAEEYITLKERLNALQGIHNKPVIAKVSEDGTRDEPYTADESANIVREMEAQNPKLREWAEKAEQFHDEFMQEWAVGSGLMSQEQYDMLKERYPHYVQTYRVRDNWGGGADTTRRGTVNTGSPIKEAVGDLSEIIPFEDAEMMQVNTIVKNARRNELFRNIYDFAKANPAAAAPYVRVVGEDAEYQAPESIDDLTGRISDAAMSDAGGIYTIRAMVDGKPVTMQVNSAFYAGLQNLFRQDRGASDTFMKRVVGPVTTGFKRVTTGDNPFFAATNLAKDAQTAYFNTISRRKLAVTYMYDAVRSAAHMAQNADDWKTFSALGGKSSTFYDNNKGFEKSLEISKRNKKGIRKALNTVHGWVTFLNENAEAVWRFNEYRAGIERYGDTPEGRMKAIQAAADVTTNFSRSGPTAKSFDTFVPYLNASIQGLDKTARQIKNHPFTTTRRALELITLPTLVLWMINKDDEDYQDLNNRTKDNYFCVPATAFDFIAKPLGLETEGKFIKIPKSREYGVAFGAAFERALRAWVQGEDIATAFKGLGSQLMTNLAPSNPVTDNIFKNIFIDLPTNRDFAGRAIVPERMQGLSPENQYDYSTSGAGRALANLWNATVGRGLGKVSPIQVDYLIDSNLGFIGDAIIGATTQPKSPQQMIEEIRNDPVGAFLAPFLNTLEQKFVADPMYQSGVTDAFYDELNAAEMAKNDKNLVEGLAADIVTPEEKYYSELLKASSEMSELRKQERALMADTSLTDDEREEQVRAIRRQINDIAKAAPENARKVREEYEKTYVPEISYLSESRYADAQEALQHGVTGQQFAQWDKRLSELTDEKGADDKKVRTEAEARSMVLDEVLGDSTLSASEKEAIADYVLISSMDSDTQKELWETVAKGKVNATDFLKFKSDIAAYEDEAKNTGTDNMANVAAILRGYDSLTDEQRDVLFQTYNETMSNNPFHVSIYEQAITENSLYQSLTDEGKAALRAFTNEYEQYINEGRELDEWRAKAYMAEKEAGIAPGIYALYRTVLETVNAQNDGNTNRSQQEVETAINTIPGLTQYQKAYIWQSANKDWKKNPFGSATVTEYQSGVQKAINPVENGKQTSPFGSREQPIEGASTFHNGLDIGANEGEPIKAILSGKVIAKSYDTGGGYYVMIDHGNNQISTYMHMQEGSTDGINVGDMVEQGQQIGKVGSTGKYSTGPHLDIRITQDGKYVDPLTVIPGYGIGPSGYVSSDSAAAAVISSGVAAAQSGSSGSSGRSGLKKLDTFDDFISLPIFK